MSVNDRKYDLDYNLNAWIKTIGKKAFSWSKEVLNKNSVRIQKNGSQVKIDHKKM